MRNLYTSKRDAKVLLNSTNAFWMSDIVIIVLVLSLSMLDGFTLYTIFDTILVETPLLSVVVTGGCSIALNFLPLIAARLIHCYRYGINGVKVWWICAIGILFLILYCSTVFLRWTARDISLGRTEEFVIITAGQKIDSINKDTASGEAVAITILLALLPLITSGINAALGLLNDDPLRRKIYVLSVQCEQIKEDISCLRAARSELDQDWKKNLSDIEDKRFQDQCELVYASGGIIRMKARTLLAQKLKGDAEAISYVTEEKLI